MRAGGIQGKAGDGSLHRPGKQRLQRQIGNQTGIDEGLTRDLYRRKEHRKGARRHQVFDADPGPALVVALSDMRDRFRIVANVVDVVGPDQPMPNLPVARAVWVPEPGLATSAECWILAGAAHHTVMSSATTREMWEALAEMVATELVTIDAGTTPLQFRRELRWNDAYHRLARGL